MGGGNCLKYLKRGWNRKEGREPKILKRGTRGVGALKKGGLEPPYKLFTHTYIYCISSNKHRTSSKHHPLISGALLGANIEISTSLYLAPYL